MKNRFAATAMAMLMASSGTLAQQTGQTTQQATQISGTAKDEAKTPYTDYTVRVREEKQWLIAATVPLDTYGAFTIPNLPQDKFYVELVNKDGKVVCGEGPFNLAEKPITDGVVIDCNKVPAAWWLLAGAAAAGITAGVVATGGPASPSR